MSTAGGIPGLFDFGFIFQRLKDIFCETFVSNRVTHTTLLFLWVGGGLDTKNVFHSF